MENLSFINEAFINYRSFPIDTVKTRLQSPHGFLKSGGFRGIYNGVTAAALGSAPAAALFFGVYEGLKPKVAEIQRKYDFFPGVSSLSHMVSASAGETIACIVRVPTEVVKQNMQANTALGRPMLTIIKSLVSKRGENRLVGGLYRGLGITLMREVPFAIVQFPLYERMKAEWSQYQEQDVSSFQAAACGSVSGGVAAALTTPSDVIKTRLMLGSDKGGVAYNGVMDVAKRVVSEEGVKTLFSGITPRVIWISMGGFVFFGVYEEFRSRLISAGL